ncbi:MAG: hypothetical protein HYX91_03885 [Chloroflexi bacterium]|nr:hypothetical protein [Chloroflexota bacterium]
MNQDIALPKLTCTRCKHVWIPRIPRKPKQCPKCRSPYWNKPKWKGIKKEDVTYQVNKDLFSSGIGKAAFIDQHGFKRREIRGKQGKGIKSGLKSQIYVDVDKTSDQETTVIHTVKEQKENGEWETVHTDIKRGKPRRRPNKQEGKK